jgi:hypothetical protein
MNRKFRLNTQGESQNGDDKAHHTALGAETVSHISQPISNMGSRNNSINDRAVIARMNSDSETYEY